MRSIQILCKLTNKCNMNCSYCFDKQNQVYDYNLNYDDVFNFFKSLLDEFDSINWVWHGGEITAIDINLFDELMFKMYVESLKYNCNVSFYMQTNGYNFSTQWDDLCVKYAISVGVSYDGCYANKLSRGYDLDLTSFNRFMNQITVINKYNVNKLIEIYEDCKVHNITLNLNLPFSTNTITSGDIVNYDLLIKNYTKFIDYYLYDITGITETTTDNFILMSLGKKSNLCYMQNCCASCDSIIATINTDGFIYACDNILEEFKLCALTSYKSSKDIDKSHIDKNIKNKSCEHCEYSFICKGGCKHRILHNDLLYCEVVKVIIPYLYNKLNNLTADDFYKLNPAVKRLLIANGYIPSYMKEKLV